MKQMAFGQGQARLDDCTCEGRTRGAIVPLPVGAIRVPEGRQRLCRKPWRRKFLLAIRPPANRHGRH